MKILVTGGAGFIGSHLVNNLLNLGQQVSILDNFTTSKRENVPKGVKIWEGDVRDMDDVSRAVAGCEVVFHLAAITDVRNSNDDTVFNVNAVGAKNVFQAAHARKAKVIFTSSAAVYGNAAIPTKEADAGKPISQYGKSKLIAEKALQQLEPENFFIARLFNVYGPKSNSVVNTFCKKITGYKDVTVYGNGLQTRDFVYVTDVVDALMLGVKNSGVYNVGSGQDISVTTLIEMIHRMTRCVPNVKHEPPKTGEISRSKADIAKIRQTGWSSHVTLEDGIKSILDSIGYKLMV